MTAPTDAPERPTFAEASRFWLKLGFISFGGPAGQIAILHREVVERLRQNERLTCTLSAITAAVVGVVLNVAVWFGLQVLFPRPWPPDWLALCVALVAFAGIQRWKWEVIPVLLGAGMFGMCVKAFVG